MLFKRSVGVAAIVLSAFGCAADTSGSGSGAGGGVGPAGGKADGDAELVLSFSSDWSESANGPLHAGDAARIDYDLDRLPDCRGTQGGIPQWGATAVYFGDDGEEHTVGLTEIVGGELRATDASLTVPEGEHLRMYFYASNRWGCIAYDSNFGDNYVFDVEARSEPAVVRFAADGADPEIEGTLRAGGAVTVEYDLDRLTDCRATRAGYPVWDLMVQYAFDGGAAEESSLTRSAGTDREPAPATLRLPSDASELELGFRDFDIYGCEGWDPPAGERYTFPLAR